MTEQVKRKAAAIDNELETLPEPPTGNLPILIIQCLNDFETNVKRLIDGDISTLVDGEVLCFFWRDWNKLAMTFRGVMAESRPALVMCDPTEVPIQIDLDDEISDTGTASRLGRKRPRTSVPSCKRSFATRFGLVQIRDIIREGVPGLPGQIDTRTIDRVIRLSLQQWNKPLEQFLKQVERLCDDMFMKHVDQVFGRWRATGLYTRVVEIYSSFLKDAMASQRKAAQRALQLELQKPASFNAEGLKIAEEKALAQIMADRQAFRATEYVVKHQELKGAKGSSRDERVRRVSDTQLGSDPYSQEVRLIGVGECGATNYSW